MPAMPARNGSPDSQPIVSIDIGARLFSNEGNITVALEVELTEELRQEGMARELINRIQNLRKERDYEVTDKIRVFVDKTNSVEMAITNNYSYICNEILATELELRDTKEAAEAVLLELTDEISVHAIVEKV